MIDNKKIEEAANEYSQDNCGYSYNINEFLAFKEGAKWAINELNHLFHPASEVPRNDNGKVLAYSKEHGYIKLYDMNAMLDETTCNTYQEMWKEEVKMYCLSDWIFVDELFDLIKKGGEQ